MMWFLYLIECQTSNHPSFAKALRAEYELTKELRAMEGLTVAGACWTQTQWPQVRLAGADQRSDPKLGH